MDGSKLSDISSSTYPRSTSILHQNGIFESGEPLMQESMKHKYLDSGPSNGGFKRSSGEQTAVENAGPSQFSTPSSRSLSPTRHRKEGEYGSRFNLAGQGLLPVSGMNSNISWKQDSIICLQHHMHGEAKKCSGEEGALMHVPTAPRGVEFPCRRHSAPFIFSSPNPLAGDRRSEKGSRFWPLGGDGECLESEGDFVGDGSSSSPTSADFVRDAVRAGFSADDLVRAEAILSNNVTSPNFWSVDCGAGQVRHPRLLASRIVETVAQLCPSPASKPWKGPLPKPRSSPVLTVGDIGVKDKRAKGEESGRRVLKEVRVMAELPKLTAEEGSFSTSVMSVTAQVESGFKFRTGGAVRLPGPAKQSLASAGRSIQVGAHPAFQCSIGLGFLLKRKGIPRGFREKQKDFDSPPGIPIVSPFCDRSFAEVVKAKGKGSLKEEGAEEGRMQRGGRRVAGARGGRGGSSIHPSSALASGRNLNRGYGYEEETEVQGRGGFRNGGRGFHGGRWDYVLGGRGRGGPQRFNRGGGRAGSSAGGRGAGRHNWQVTKTEAISSNGANGGRKGVNDVGDNGLMDAGVVQKGVEDVLMEVAQEVAAVGEGEVARSGIRCARCTRKGHLAAGCTAEIYCVICDSNDHVNHRCPILKMPRPVAQAVGYAVHGLGFYHIPHPPLPRTKKDSKLALITVVGGSLSKEQVITQLQRIMPGKWTWSLEEHGDDAFIAQFPSKSELQRSIAFGGADVKEAGVPHGVRLNFEEWLEKEEGFLLPKVWVKVVGMRKALREFLNLWAVGSLLGSTQTVDMETTRKSNFGRICVAVLNPKLIPRHMDVVIGDHYFELDFEVEKWGFDENGEEVEVDWNGKEEGGNGSAGEEDHQEDNLLGDDLVGTRDLKRQKFEGSDKGADQSSKGMDSGMESLKMKVQNMSELEFMNFLKKKAEEILDISVNKVLEKEANSIVTEEAVVGVKEMDSEEAIHNAEGARREGELIVESMEFNFLNANSDILNGIGAGIKQDSIDNVKNQQGCPNSEEGVPPVEVSSFLPAPVALEEHKVLMAAAISEVGTSPSRSSPRLAGVSDEHTMTRAERRAVARNLENAEAIHILSARSACTPRIAHGSQQFPANLQTRVNSEVEDDLLDFVGESVGADLQDGGVQQVQTGGLPVSLLGVGQDASGWSVPGTFAEGHIDPAGLSPKPASLQDGGAGVGGVVHGLDGALAGVGGQGVAAMSGVGVCGAGAPHGAVCTALVRAVGGAAHPQTGAAAGGNGKGGAVSAVVEVLAAAAIKEVRMSPKRSSPRLAKHNDDDSLKKAEKRAAWKNLDFSGGNFQGDVLDPTVVPAA